MPNSVTEDENILAQITCQNTKQLDPTNIQTTILAEIFEEYEDIAEHREVLETNSTMAKISLFMNRLHPIKTFSLVIIFLSFYVSRPDWCREAHEKGGIFSVDDFNCQKSIDGIEYYTINNGYKGQKIFVVLMTWICMLFICHEELLMLCLKSRWTTKVRCAFTVAFFLIDVVFGVLNWCNIVAYSFNMYARICFVILATSYQRNACKKMGWAIIKSYNAIVIYLLLFGIYTCIVYVAVCGTTKLDYYNTKENSNFYSFNQTSMHKIMLSLFIMQTKDNYPDILLKNFKENEILFGVIFGSYVFLSVFLVSNIMGAIFYSNYKSHFIDIVKELKNQQWLKKIVSVSQSKNGIIKFKVLNDLLDKLNSPEFTQQEFERELKKYNIKKFERAIQTIMDKEEIQRKKQQNPEEFEEEKRKREFVPYKQRTSGYNHKNKESFDKVRYSMPYAVFFFVINLYIAISPLRQLEDSIEYYSLNRYGLIEIAAMFALIDPILVFIFHGMKQFRRTLYKIEVASSVAILAFGIVQNFCKVELYDSRNFEQQFPYFFSIYCFVCLSKLSRIILVFLENSKAARSLVNVINNIWPFIKIVLGAICIVFLFYAQVGVQLFGGYINSKTAQEHSDTIPELYKYLNFNDIPSAMMTLWSLFLNRGWTNIMNEESMATGIPGSCIYYISFICIMNLFIMKIVLGLMIDAVLTDFRENQVETKHFEGTLYTKILAKIKGLDEKRKNLLFD